MVSSLMPEKALVISPALAATIGLEEAVMLAMLHELSSHRAQHGWVRINEADLHPFLPFWSAHDIQRIATSLRDKGIIQLRSPPFLSSRELDFSLQTSPTHNNAPPANSLPTAKLAVPAKAVMEPAGTSAQLMPPNWQPDAELSRQLSQLGIPQAFVELQIPEFVRYWRDRGEAHHAWGNRFLKQALRQWREQEQHVAIKAQSVPMDASWQPGPDAIEILSRDGVSLEFIHDSLPEFILYWRERGTSDSTWNSKFLQHIRRQWAIFTARLVNDPTPRAITPNWQPSGDVFDILQMATIDKDFARAQVPEFVLYWADSKQLHSSWNSKFLHHVKYRWAKRHQQPWQGDTDGFIEKHTDRSWADST